MPEAPRAEGRGISGMRISHRGLEYIGSGVITYVHPSNIPPPDLGIEDYEEDFDGS